MEEERINIDFEKNEYLFKIIYLIRINQPKSEYMYIIMFLLKYIGLILLSISLNEWKKELIQSRENEINNNFSLFSLSAHKSIYKFLTIFLINGNNLKILK